MQRRLSGVRVEKVLWWVAFLIVFSLVIHAFDFHHSHPEEIFGHNEMKAFLHGGDKKWLF